MLFKGVRSVKEILQLACRELQVTDGCDPVRESRILLCYVLGCEIEFIIKYPDYEVNSKQIRLYNKLIKRRLLHEPISRIIGIREFWSFPFKISEATLDPRPDSEVILDAVIMKLKNRNKKISVLDLGVGSGCLLLSILREYPSSVGVGVDISFKATQIAKDNAKKAHLLERVLFVQGNWTKSFKGSFDLIVSNPPYICESEIENLQKEVKLFDPIIALNGGKDGLSSYRSFVFDIRRLLSSNGIFICEVGFDQYKEVSKILEKEGLFVENILKDLSGINRCLITKKL